MSVPEDFPHVSFRGAVSGFQLKFSVVKGHDGLLREPGTSAEDRERDFVRCSEVLDWADGFLREKALKPKYTSLTPTQMLEKFKVNLDRDFEMPVAYRSWILARLADRFQAQALSSRSQG